METERPKVGVGVMIWKDNKILLGKRLSARGKGEYWFPGGHLEWQESLESCAVRETEEETGLSITNIRFLVLINEKAHGKHYVNIGMIADWKEGEPVAREPEAFESWDWYDPENLPTPLFAIIPHYFEALESKRYFFDE